MVNSTDRVHRLVLDSSTSNFETGAKIFLPEFGLLRDKIITKLEFDSDGQQGFFESMCLTLRDDQDKNILVDYPVSNLFFQTGGGSFLNRRYISYFVNVNLAKSFLRSYEPTFSYGGDQITITIFYRDNK